MCTTVWHVNLGVIHKNTRVETMNDLSSIPGWLGTAAASAIVAVLTYIAKTIHGLWSSRRDLQRTRYAQLLQLDSLLKTGKRIFDIQ